MGHDLVQHDGLRILVVEDNDDFRLLMELTHREEGYRVDSACCAEDAFHLLNTNDYHLVLSDYSLPARSGAWLLSKTRRIRGEVPFAIITGDPEAPGIPRDAVVIPKRLDFDRLLTELQRLLTRVGESTAAGARSRQRALSASLPASLLDSSASA